MADKVSKETAAYQTSAKGKELCSRCSMFRLMNRCTLVEGTISPFGWCKFFEPKERK